MIAGQTNRSATRIEDRTVTPNKIKIPAANPNITKGQSQAHSRTHTVIRSFIIVSSANRARSAAHHA